MTAATSCQTCGTEPLENARFCHGCGSPVAELELHAEYKQVTVLFADVVHSMDIAAAVGAERLREIMTDLADRCATVVQRYGGTVDKFTGDGIMAVFGAPVRWRITLSAPAWRRWGSGGGEGAWRRHPSARRCGPPDACGTELRSGRCSGWACSSGMLGRPRNGCQRPRTRRRSPARCLHTRDRTARQLSRRCWWPGRGRSSS